MTVTLGMSRAEAIALRCVVQRAQWHICPICGGDLPITAYITRMEWRPSFDHVTPLSAGGYDGAGNVLVTHRICNTDKGNRPPTGCELVWLAAVNARMGWV